MVPVKCDYCCTVSAGSNCKSCGGPLPVPEVAEYVVERRYDMSREMIDVTTFNDTDAVYICGIKRAELTEIVNRKERIR